MEKTMSKPQNLFPLGIATGRAHCNRDTERTLLKAKIIDGTHAWLWARRRMGKTSLIEQTLNELAKQRPPIPSIVIDLNIVYDAESLAQRLRSGVAELAMSFVPKGQKTPAMLLKAFKKLDVSFSLKAGPATLQIQKPADEMAGISDLLEGLDRAARAYKKRAVVVLDEFQQVQGLHFGNTKTTVEGAIKHAVERSKNVSYIFCGSQRHLLAQMFEQRDRSLVRHCEKIELKRISRVDYERYIGRAARNKWKKPLGKDVIDHILDLTYRHPYYVNALCRRLWQQTGLPSKRSVSTTWRVIAEEDASIVAYIVGKLSAAQRAMLTGIATAENGVVEYPTGEEFLRRVRLSGSTGGAARQVLEQEDLIRRIDGGWTLVDPVMAEYLKNR
jgi:hypothetical protein